MNRMYLLGIIASAAVSLTSCSNDETSEATANLGNSAISFGTYLGRNANTRATIYTNTTLQTDGFGVFAFQDKNWTSDEADFMNNQKVDYVSNQWSYTPLKYWADNKISFFAYAPYDANQTWANTKSISFAVDNDATKQKDLLVADGQMDKNKDEIKFNFKHALSRIGFTINSTKLDSRTTVTITSVEIGKKGDDNTITGAFYTSGTKALGTNGAYEAWKDATGTQSFKFETANFKTSEFKGSDETKKHQLNADDSYLMVIPQDFATDGFDVLINYKVKSDDAAEQTGKAVANVKLNLESGKAYTLNLYLVTQPGGDGGDDPIPGLLSPIVISADVADWTEVDAVNLETKEISE